MTRRIGEDTDRFATEVQQRRRRRRQDRAERVLPAHDLALGRRGGKVPDAKQTFVMDFAPFRDACFVTFHDAEYENPPLNSEFYVYLNGKEVFEFPNQFNGVTTGCWIEAVSFADLNDDELKDIIVAGLCSAKTAPYSENMVYVKTGDGFRTDENANYKLADFTRIKEIENFVRRNRQLFFK